MKVPLQVAQIKGSTIDGWINVRIARWLVHETIKVDLIISCDGWLVIAYQLVLLVHFFDVGNILRYILACPCTLPVNAHQLLVYKYCFHYSLKIFFLIIFLLVLLFWFFGCFNWIFYYVLVWYNILENYKLISTKETL
jgi:hypothetical protein